MKRRRFAVLATILVAVNIFFWLAASGFALPSGGIVQTLLGGRMIKADIVWLTPDGKIQDSRLDRGVITALSTTSITLRERDGSTDTIPVSDGTVVRLGYQTGTTDQLRRGMRVVVSRPANEPADTIQVESLGG